MIVGVFFLLALMILTVRTNRVLEVKSFYGNNSSWPTTSTYEQFYKMKRNSIDVLFLGSSVCVNAFSPQEMYNIYGIRSYNLGSEQQSMVLSYYWLKEALRFQKPKVVIIDTTLCYENFNPRILPLLNTGEGLIRKCLDPMRWSSVKD